MIVSRALDLIAGLLANRQGLRGILYWAVGTGDPAWDAAPPAIDPATTELQAEIYRKRLDPSQMTYDSSSRTIAVSVVFGPNEAIGTLREFGLFGGDSSPRTGSGFLINYTIHAALQHAAGTSLGRQVHFALDSDRLLNSAVDLIAGLLIGQPGLAGVQYWALGAGDASWDSALPARDPKTSRLAKEVFRRPFDSDFDLQYLRGPHVLDARTRFPYDQAATALREVGLFGGNATGDADSGILLSYQAHAPVDKTTPQTLEQELRITLGTDVNATVPNVVGMTPDAATAAIQAVNLLRGQVTLQENDAQAGKVMSQAPPAGAAVPEGSLVDLVAGIHTRIVVPNLTGLTLAAADAVLANVGLVRAAGTPPAEESLFPAGTILRQTPAPGARADTGSAVRVVLATAVTTLVPDLVGHTAGEAPILLAAAQLQPAAAGPGIQSSPEPDGTILSQDPAAGASEPIQSEVSFTVAGPPAIAVPDLARMLPDAAAAALRQAAAALLTKLGRPSEPPGLALGGQTSAENAAAPGTIISQTPAANAQAWLYSAVQIVVAAPLSAQAPNLIGLTQAAATAALTAAGLTLGAVVVREDVAAAGTVIVQDPAAGVQLAKGSAVAITLAQPILVAVPDTVGHLQSYAQEVVTARGLVLGAPAEVPSAQPDGTVLSQTPAANSQVAIGSTVNISIATKVVVPSVIGKTVADATTTLTAARLVLTAGAQTISAQPEGTVVTQDPAAGARVAPGAAVTVTTARGVDIPSIVGQTLVQATTLLKGLGLLISVSAQTVSAQPEGTVLTQNPAAGGRLPLGGAVQVTTATGVVVPSLIGQTSDQATAALKALGLVLTVTGQTVSAQPEGTVLTQNPAAGGRLPLGGAVQVTTATGVVVPSLIGQTSDQATAALKALGLVLTVTGQTVSAQPEGTVLTQNPAAGQKLPLGGAVQVTTATGVLVPSLIGQTSDQATAALKALGLVLSVTGQTVSAQPEGTVLTQNPAAGQKLPLGGAVQVTTATGVLVPNVVGQAQAAATKAVTTLGLKLAVTRTTPSTQPAGTVLTQNPAAGQKLPLGGTVQVTVAGLVTVPSVIGMNTTQATAVLTPLNLKLVQAGSAANPAPAGTIFAQSPAANAQAAPGSSVSVQISLGPPLVVPNIVGVQIAQAQSTLQQLGLQMTISSRGPSNLPSGAVVSQDPAAGASASPGSTVSVVASTGPPPVAVPQLVGQNVAAATALLAAAGLSIAVTTVAGAGSPGAVLSQNPVAGTQVARGSTVQVTVSLGITIG